jgi:hypothetical protein
MSLCYFLRKDTHFIGGKVSLDQNNSIKLLHCGHIIAIFFAVNSLILTNKILQIKKYIFKLSI